MEDNTITLEELLSQHRELQLTCEIWMAASEAKDEHIRQLERENNQLRKKIARAGHGTPRRAEAAPRVVRLAAR